MADSTKLLTVGVAICIPACVLLVGVVRWLLQIRKIGKKVDLFPGPVPSFFTGNMLQFPPLGEEFLAWQTSLCKEHKTAFRTWYGPFRPCVELVHPSTVKLLLKTAAPKPFSGGGGYGLLLDWLGYGLLLNSGPVWFRNRRLLTPAFHFDVLKPYCKVYNEATDILLEKLSTSRHSETSPGGSVEVFTPVSLCTLNVMLRCAFSYQDDIQRQGSDHPYVETVSRLSQLMMQRLFNPLLYFDTIYKLTKKGKMWSSGCDYAHQVAYELIEKRKKQLKDKITEDIQSKRAMDFLDILLLARDDNGEGLTDLEIRQEVDTFLFEGHDTTASAISWCLYNLASHPEYQSKAREEVDQILEGRESDYIEWDDLSQLPYLTMCLKESMRHTPPVPMLGRELDAPLEIEGVVLEPGTFLDVHIWSVHHNPLVWGEDHMDYRPDRFSPDNLKTMDSHAFIPFSAGPRNCIGQNFAMNELKTMIARVLHRFNLDVDPDRVPERVPELVMRTKGGLYLTLTER